MTTTNRGMALVRKPVQRVAADGGWVREGSTGRVVTMLPQVWAVADMGGVGSTEERHPTLPPQRAKALVGDPGLSDKTGKDGPPTVVAEFTEGAAEPSRLAVVPGSRPKVEVAFYRKYTEAMLRRYMRLSMETGRVPSLLGKEMFRGHVTHYRVGSFEDAVLFCMDVERCLAVLDPLEKEMVRRVALQEYTQGEAAAMMGIALRNLVRGYGAALDRVTRKMIAKGMLVPLKSCQ